jgi:predicted nucleic acid-binding protein
MMILADTSVWVGHFRGLEPDLAPLLLDGAVLMHPFVLGELACGNLRERGRVLEDLQMLPSSTLAAHEEVMLLLEKSKLWGIGWIDAHLIASALLSRCILWTLDERLKKTAIQAGVARTH